MKGSVIASPTLKERDVKGASRICIIIRFVKVGSKRFCMKRRSGDHKIYKEFNFEILKFSECNCNPFGVVRGFGGCDKVAPGELCECRQNVQGRTCSQCKPTYWNLSPYNEEGCVDCACNVTGTLSLLNDCDMITGQCACKRFVGGRACDMCADGYWHMKQGSHLGCEPCNCDVGGAIGTNCNMNTGQCQCRPRVEGLKCDQPIRDHYFPTLWHHKVKKFSV